MTALGKVEFDAKNVLTGKVEHVVIETAHSHVAQFASGRGWAAALNGFDLGCKMATGKTEAEAIDELLEQLDLERVL